MLCPGEVAISGPCCEAFCEVQALVCDSMPGIAWEGRILWCDGASGDGVWTGRPGSGELRPAVHS